MPIETIYGNLQGLKSSQLKQLQKLYHQRLPSDRLTTSEFAQRVASISTEVGQSICVYINRRGQIIRVGVGTPHQTQIPPLELPRYGNGRLSGIRCVATNLKAEVPSEATLTAMVIQRLDALVMLTLTGEGFKRRGGGATGYIKQAYLAHLLPIPTHERINTDLQKLNFWSVSPPLSLDMAVKQDFIDLIDGLEAEFQREFIAQEVDSDQDLALLVGLKIDKMTNQQFEDGLAELARLVETAGGQVLKTVHQKRSHPHPQTVVGEGKVQEIALSVQTLGANLVVFDQDLSPAQVRNLEKKIGI